MNLRFVPLTAIDEPESVEPADLTSLIRSIHTFGVLHPLLLFAEHGRYQVIAGRKRFYAARAAGLTSVPCFVPPVPRAGVEALAQADNLRCVSPRGDGKGSPATDRSVSLSIYVARHLAGIASVQRLLVEAKNGIARRAALDLIHVHTTRARWLIQAVDLLAAHHVNSDTERQTLGGLIENLAADVAPEARLAGVPLRVRIDDRAYTARFDKHAFSVGLMGAIVALLPFVEAASGSAITLTAARPAESLTVDIGQAPTLMDPPLGRSFFDPAWTTRPGGWPALLGALALKTVVERHEGAVAYETDSARAHLRITLRVQR
jgi:hypothetical protein